MWMVFVVALEPPRKLRQDRLCIRATVNVNIISLERFDEGLGHAVLLGRSHRRRARYETDDWAKEAVSYRHCPIVRNLFNKLQLNLGTQGQISKSL